MARSVDHMAEDKDRAPDPTQETPQGAVIPVPERADVMRDLLRVAKADRPEPEPSATGSGGTQEK